MLSPRPNTTILDRLPPAGPGNQTQLEGTLTQAFGSPEIRPVTVETQYAVIAVQCPCGEATTVTLTGFDETEAFCSCGRTWQVRVTAEEVGTPVQATVNRAGE